MDESEVPGRRESAEFTEKTNEGFYSAKLCESSVLSV